MTAQGRTDQRAGGEAFAIAEAHGFSLRSVTWGYRDLFADTLAALVREGLIGPEREAATEKVFALLKSADQSCFDHVLKEFLAALNPQNRWLLDLPGLFCDVVDLGRAFAESRVYFGIGFFHALAEGGLGRTPAEMRHMANTARRLREVDEELAFSFVKGFARLADRLQPEELDRYVNEGLTIFAGNRKAGLGFMEGTVKSSENIIRSLTRECRLDDAGAGLAALLRALVGYDVEVGGLDGLDSDFLIERGTRMVCLYKWLYLPVRLRFFDSARRNHEWYLLMAVTAAGLLAEKSFSLVHGHPDYRQMSDLVGESVLAGNLLQALEFRRVLTRIRARWPGARRLVRFGLETEFAHTPPNAPAEQFFRDLMEDRPDAPAVASTARTLADDSVNVFETAARLHEPWTAEVVDAYPGIDSAPLRTFAFLPDWMYPGEVSAPPADSLVADLKDAAEARRSGDESDEDDDPDAAASGESDGESDEDEEEPGETAVAARYVYDEWSQPDNDYFRDHCYLREVRPDPTPIARPPDDLGPEARQVRQAFERLKPDLVRKEKHLPDGETINLDLLQDYLVQRKREPSPRVVFYEKPIANRRDLAVLILLDTSGSTGEAAGHEKVLEVERRAALLLGQGLDALGDRFHVAGFSSHGREDCVYSVYKDFDDAWGGDAVNRLYAARPANATRIGPALRHAGFRLGRIEARQRLIILITDGKPMDSGYDPHTRYAQFDVRMACEENERAGVHTVGISTEENTLADMEIMFPGRRFAILPDIRMLPRILPRLYLRMTA